MEKENHILIVDDDRLMRVAIQRILAKSDGSFVAEEASDSAAMMNILEEKDIDCVILDYLLVDTDGLSVLEELKKRDIDIPVIMMTGQGDEMIAVKTLKAGAYDYLPKSILSHNDATEILSYTIENAINLHEANVERTRTAIALRKSEERYRSLVEKSPMLIIRFFPDDHIISFVNDTLCSYYGIERSQLAGESIYKYVLNNDMEDIKEVINSLTKENSVTNLEYYSKTGKGMRWQLWTFQALLGPGGEILEYQCIGEDITPLKKAEEELYKQKVYFQSILDSQENMIMVTDKSEIIEANHSLLIYFGYKSLDDLRQAHSDIIELALDVPDYIKETEGIHWIDAVLKDPESSRLISFRSEWRKETKVFSVNISLLSLEREVYVVTFSDVTLLEKRSKTFEEKASLDALTGIFNKDKFNELLESNIEMAKRYDNDLSLIFFDIDHFKKVNDTYGHQTGDYVLQEVVNIISRSMRKSDIFARWGGEEFVVLLPQINIENAIKVADKFRKKIMDFDFRDVKQLTCSFGVTMLGKTDGIDKFVKRADRGLYKAKESGRNRVVGVKASPSE